jgi:glycosyltransferase involved in cell wall biosynthesis
MKKLVIVSSPTQFAWNGESLRKGPLGGSETAAIYVAEYCARGGNKGKLEPLETYVFCTCTNPQKINGVIYAPLEMLQGFLMTNFVDYYVVYRWAKPLYYTSNVGKKFLWLQDISCLVDTLNLDHTFSKVVCLTPWHRTDFSRLMEIPESMIDCIGNAVNPELYPTNQNVPLRFFYSSNPIRGMFNLLHMWPAIREAFPTATLKIYTQLDHTSHVPGLSVLIENINGENGVDINDRVPQEVLAKEFAKADYWLYPTNFPETYCITALEAQVCGCIPIYTDVGCLKDTVGDRGIMLKHNNNSPIEQTAEVISHIKYLENNPDEKSILRRKGMIFGQNQTWDKVGSEWYDLLVR